MSFLKEGKKYFSRKMDEFSRGSKASPSLDPKEVFLNEPHIKKVLSEKGIKLKRVKTNNKNYEYQVVVEKNETKKIRGGRFNFHLNRTSSRNNLRKNIINEFLNPLKTFHDVYLPLKSKQAITNLEGHLKTYHQKAPSQSLLKMREIDKKTLKQRLTNYSIAVTSVVLLTITFLKIVSITGFATSSFTNEIFSSIFVVLFVVLITLLFYKHTSKK